MKISYKGGVVWVGWFEEVGKRVPPIRGASWFKW